MFPIQKKSFLFILFLFVGLLAFVGFILNRQYSQKPLSQNLPPSSVAPTTSSSSPAQATSTIRTKTYRNTEFGFEFQYPADWTFHENTFGSPFSRFNLVGASPEENGHPDPLAPSLLINIVTPDFADRAFYDLKGTDIIVANISGKKYEYEEEGLSKISIVLSFGKNKIILGGNRIYEDIFNQILFSFKFLKSSQ